MPTSHFRPAFNVSSARSGSVTSLLRHTTPISGSLSATGSSTLSGRRHHAEKLAEWELAAGSVIERPWPFVSTDLKFLWAKLAAMAILIDDSMQDDAVHAHLVEFSARLYRGEAQQNGLLVLYHTHLKELAEVFGDAVLRDLAVVAWIYYIDACLMEKRIFMTEGRKFNLILARLKSNRQRQRSKIDPPQMQRLGKEDGLAMKFPNYLREKSGIPESFAVGIFKASKDQNLPMTRFIKTFPDLVFHINVVNDVLSFHKEELDGETHNLIRLRTRSMVSSGVPGTGANGEWTPYDTLQLLCGELRDATYRIDGLLRLNEREKKVRGEAVDSDIDNVDVDIAMQWKAYRHGYSFWHLECRRYRLDFLRLSLTSGAEHTNM